MPFFGAKRCAKIMNKINYPKDSKELAKFEQAYRDCLDKTNVIEINSKF